MKKLGSTTKINLSKPNISKENVGEDNHSNISKENVSENLETSNHSNIWFLKLAIFNCRHIGRPQNVQL